MTLLEKLKMNKKELLTIASKNKDAEFSTVSRVLLNSLKKLDHYISTSKTN